MVAIITAAGKGTRMASVTGGKPKELLPLGSRSVLQRIVDECREAGIERVIVVNSREKPEIDNLVGHMSCVEIAYQDRMRGVADAVAAAGTQEDALVLMGDAVYQGGSPSGRLVRALSDADGAIAAETVSDQRCSLYGILEGDPFVDRILEKPEPGKTRSRAAVAARYAFGRSIMKEIMQAASDHERETELGLTEVLNHVIHQGARVVPVPLLQSERRVDCGSPEEYKAAMGLEWD